MGTDARHTHGWPSLPQSTLCSIAAGTASDRRSIRTIAATQRIEPMQGARTVSQLSSLFEVPIQNAASGNSRSVAPPARIVLESAPVCGRRRAKKKRAVASLAA